MPESWTEAKLQNRFEDRHIGNSRSDNQEILDALGYQDLEELVKAAIPDSIQNLSSLDLPEPLSETEASAELRKIVDENKVYRSLIGNGYFGTNVPSPIKRNILENPSWYTQYTPYQSEIAQGRLEALINFQTMVIELTGMQVANASLLDEATAAAEAMTMAYSQKKKHHSNTFLVSDSLNPQSIAVLKTRAYYLDFNLIIKKIAASDLREKPFGVIMQYPATDGSIEDIGPLIQEAKQHSTITCVATDLLALCLLKSPGDLNADIVVGNSQRFGVPLGFGGPHAGFIAATKVMERKLPGRIVGLSKDSNGKPAYRLSLATREQHIRRDKATSNICTAQVLLAIMSGMYAVYHGPKGLTKIAQRTHSIARIVYTALKTAGLEVASSAFFDTLKITTGSHTNDILKKARENGYNFRKLNDVTIAIAFDEKSNIAEAKNIARIFDADLDEKTAVARIIPSEWLRSSPFLEHRVFNSYHNESDLMRYIKKLEKRDLSLTHSMIPLGSCTMKLNAASELEPVSWEKISDLHPFAPEQDTAGYKVFLNQLEKWLASITGFHSVSLQPNSGAQGEYAGLIVIRKYQEHTGQGHRNICLIPSSAHGTNPASAVMAGLKIVVIKCDSEGNIDREDFERKAEKHAKSLSTLMITYPSTHGVFEEGISEICEIVHGYGGQIYMDGANLQAQISLCKAGEFGPDVCHINLHKTFCIPHGGGGPGVGPIAVRQHLSTFLPSHPLIKVGGEHSVGPVSAAPWGSPSILPISWMYIRMMGDQGLAKATRVAILNANYIAKRLNPHFPIVYKGANGLVAHECIIDLKPTKKSSGVDENDIAKRLIDYGFHAPTVSWPVPNSMMIEPTESEPKSEIDRFCDAMIAIAGEIKKIESGEWPKEDNPLKKAPHTAFEICQDSWERPYSRELAAFPLKYTRENKFWPYVNRVDNAFGDRNLICSCPNIEEDE
ncbi:MAG TPA: glycine dehydrogenase (aminomethyl-transferring) [Acidimicrobiaceae bacterium]|nr:glycine dehydrogenase (aminomethyl-transferring) [Acidimicrobiaceae bacterium]